MSAELLTELVERMKRAEFNMSELYAKSEGRGSVTVRSRLAGKREGVALARSYVEEQLRDLRTSGGWTVGAERSADPKNQQVGDVFRAIKNHRKTITVTIVSSRYVLANYQDNDETPLSLGLLADYYEAIPKPVRRVVIEQREPNDGETPFSLATISINSPTIYGHHYWTIVSDSESS